MDARRSAAANRDVDGVGSGGGEDGGRSTLLAALREVAGARESLVGASVKVLEDSCEAQGVELFAWIAGYAVAVVDGDTSDEAQVIVPALKRVTQTVPGPQEMSLLLTYVFDVQNLIGKGCESREAMVRALAVCDAIAHEPKNRAAEEQQYAELGVRFGLLLNAAIGMCASEEGGKGGDDLPRAINSLLQRKVFLGAWTRDHVVCNQMLIMLSQDMQVSSRSLDQASRTVGVLDAWLIVWRGVSQGQVSKDESLTQLDSWANSVGTFAQNLFQESLWSELDVLAARCEWWFDFLASTPASSNVWFNLLTPLTSALRRPVVSTMGPILKTIESVAPKLPADAIDRLLFAPGGSLKFVVENGHALEAVKRVYSKCASIESLGNETIGLLNGRNKASSAWTQFVLELAKHRGLSLRPSSVSMQDILSVLGHDYELRQKWVATLMETKSLDASDSSTVLSTALEDGDFKLVELILSARFLAAPDKNLERCLETLGISDACRASALDQLESPVLALRHLDDASSLVRDSAMQVLGRLSQPLSNNGVLVVSNDSPLKVAAAGAVAKALFSERNSPRLLHCFLSAVQGNKKDLDTLFQWLDEGSKVVKTWNVDQWIAAWLATSLVRQKLHSSFGKPSATLPQLSALLQNIDASWQRLPSGDRRRTRLHRLFSNFIYMLELEMFKAAEAGRSGGPSADKVDRFFATNENVCSEWLRRIRPVALSATRRVSGGLDPQILWQGWQDLVSGHSASLGTVWSICQALKARGEAAVMLDLLPWADDEVSSEAAQQAIRACSFHAAGRLETAARTFLSAYHLATEVAANHTANQQALDTLSWCANGALEAWAELGDWHSMKMFTDALEVEQEKAWKLNQIGLADALAVRDTPGLLLSRATALLDMGDFSGASYLLGTLDSQLDALDAAKYGDLVILKKLAGSPRETPQVAATLGKKLIEPLQYATFTGCSAETINAYQSRLWLVQLLDHGLPKEKLPEPLNRCSLPVLQMLARATKQNPDFHDKLLVAQGSNCREYGDIDCARERLTRVYKPDSALVLKEMVACDAADVNAVVDVPRVQNLVQIYQEEDPDVAQQLCMILAETDIDAKRDFHLQKACELTQRGAAGTECWFALGAWAASKDGLEDLSMSSLAAYIRSDNHKAGSKRQVACLRLLALIEQHGTRDTLSMDSIPSCAWLPLIPQLFAAASSSPTSSSSLSAAPSSASRPLSEEPDPAIQALVLAVARDHPKDIMWNAVAGRKQLAPGLFSKLRASLVDFDLSESVISELMGSAIWLEERWCALIGRTLAQKSKTVEAIELLQNNQAFDEETTREKCAAVLQPTISALKDLFAATFGGSSDELESPDATTLSRLGRAGRSGDPKGRALGLQRSIELAIDSMERFHEIGIEQSWAPLETEHRKLQLWMKRVQSMSKLSEFSPKLFEDASPTTLCVPGKSGVLLESFVDKVCVLNTKTRPKRLWVRGSDGQEYPFLLKGGEDMRVDERIMQLGRVVNELLETKGPHTQMRTYAVVPLGPSVGLVQWIENAIPLLSLYRKWQQTKGNDAPASGSDYLALITQEIKKTMGLDDNGFKALQRREWPREVLVQVFERARSTVPRDLLRRALWVSAPNPAAWWARSQRYATSVAASSIVGHIVGLGDRHLDNILLDMSGGLQSGQVVHIDYAVCFDKGRLLRVPETVPFRLTPTMKACLPFSREDSAVGREGLFATWCQKVMSVVCGNRDLVTTLVQSLVTDPHIDWMSDEENTRSADYSLDVNVSISLLASEVDLEATPSALQLERDVNGEMAKAILDELEELNKSEQDCGEEVERANSALKDHVDNGSSSNSQLADAVHGVVSAASRLDELRKEVSTHLRSVRTQQRECDSIQAQVANGVIGLQEDHVLSKLRHQCVTALASLISEDGLRLSSVVRGGSSINGGGSTMEDENAVVDAGRLLRKVSQEALAALENLRELVSFYSEVREYGADTTVEDWQEWFHTSRSEANDIMESFEDLGTVLHRVSGGSGSNTSSNAKQLEQFTQDLERFAAEETQLDRILTSLSPEAIYSNIQETAAVCNDERVAWRHAQSISWFWSTGSQIERSQAAIEAVEKRASIRKRLLLAQSALSSALDRLRWKSNKWKGEVEARKRVIADIENAMKSLTHFLDSVVKIEAHGRDLRIVNNVTEGYSAAPLDARFQPILENLAVPVRDFLGAVRESLAAASKVAELQVSLGGHLAQQRDLKQQLKLALETRDAASRKLSTRLRMIRRAAYVDNVQVWANISNIRRAADKEGPYFTLATRLVEARNRLLRRKGVFDLPLLLEIAGEIRKQLSAFVELAQSTSASDYGRRQAADQESRKRRKQAMASEVLRRLHSKLDTGSGVVEKVDSLVKAAVAPDVLSRMYEGWMPFV